MNPPQGPPYGGQPPRPGVGPAIPQQPRPGVPAPGYGAPGGYSQPPQQQPYGAAAPRGPSPHQGMPNGGTMGPPQPGQPGHMTSPYGAQSSQHYGMPNQQGAPRPGTPPTPGASAVYSSSSHPQAAPPAQARPPSAAGPGAHPPINGQYPPHQPGRGPNPPTQQAPSAQGGPQGGMGYGNPLLAMDPSNSMSGVPVGTASPMADRGGAPHTQSLASDSQGYLATHNKSGHGRGHYPTPANTGAAPVGSQGSLPPHSVGPQQPGGFPGQPQPMSSQSSGQFVHPSHGSQPGLQPPMGQSGMPPRPGTTPTGSQPGMGVPPPMGLQPGMPPQMGMQPGMPPPMGMQPGMPPPMGSQPGMGMQPGMPPQMGMQQGMLPQMGMQPGMPPPMGSQPGMGMQPGMQPQMGMQQAMPPQMGGQPGMGMQPGGMAGMPGGQMQAQKSGSRIDPNQIPSPVTVMEKDQKEYVGQQMYYGTCSKPAPPLATTDFIAMDEGNSAPRCIRMSVNSLPATEDLSKTSKIPVAAIISPFAELRPGEKPVPVVDHGTNGPVRCRRCKAYINPFVQFVDGGRRFVCNLCGFANEVPQEYFCNLDYQGRRMDINERLELLQGTADFKVTSEYCNREPKPCRYLFLIDSSFAAVQSGMLTAATWTIKNALSRLPKPEGAEHSPIRIGIATYDRSINFYNMNGALSQPQQLIVCDTEDPFVPLGENGLTVDVGESREVIEQLLDNLPTMHERTREQDAKIGPALEAIKNAMETTGGRVFVFHMNLPIAEGKGQLRNRDDQKALGSDREPPLLKPNGEFYTELGKAMSKAGISVDMFLFPTAYTDIATLGEVCDLTGGHLYVYPNYNARADGQKFSAELTRAMTRPFAYEAIMRVRASEGLRPTNYYGSFVLRNGNDMEMAAIDCDRAVAVRFHYDGTIPEGNQHAYVQVALLHTNAFGDRHVRVLNYQMRVVNQLSDVFRHAELDTILNYMAKQACDNLKHKPSKQIKDSLTEKGVGMLAVYRKHCASTSSPGQLILPEALKLLPVYVNAMMKTDMFRTGADVKLDMRSEALYAVKDMTVASSIAYIYPRMICVSDYQDEGPQAPLPSAIRLSYERLDPSKQYLLENGQVVYLWVGFQTPSSWLQAVLGVADYAHVDPNMLTLPELDTPESRALRSLIDRIRGMRTRFLRVVVIRQRDGSEAKWNLQMMEDAALDTMSYVDFLCYMHRQIQSSL